MRVTDSAIPGDGRAGSVVPGHAGAVPHINPAGPGLRPVPDDRPDLPVPPPTALRQLLAGNRRFLSGRTMARTAEDARAHAAGQAPVALVLACVDSRVPVEIIFDQGFGQVCVIRSAGQVLDRAVRGSVELSVAVLGVSLVMVLGHERCGAIRYAVDTLDGDGPEPEGDLSFLVKEIEPALAGAEDQRGDRYERVMRAHVANGVAQVGTLPAVRTALADGRVWVVGARYDLDHGRVRLIA